MSLKDELIKGLTLKQKITKKKIEAKLFGPKTH